LVQPTQESGVEMVDEDLLSAGLKSVMEEGAESEYILQNAIFCEK